MRQFLFLLFISLTPSAMGALTVTRECFNDRLGRTVECIYESDVCLNNVEACEEQEDQEGNRRIALKSIVEAPEIRPAAETPTADRNPSPTEATPAMNSMLTTELNECIKSAQVAYDSCADDASILNRARSAVSQLSTGFARMVAANPRMCNNMPNYSSAASSATAGWIQVCKSKAQDCFNVCEEVIPRLRSAGFTAALNDAREAKNSCLRSNKAAGDVNQKIQEAVSSAAIAVACMNDPTQQNISGNLPNLGQPNTPSPGFGGPGPEYTSPAVGSGRLGSGTDERGIAGPAGDLGSPLGTADPTNATEPRERPKYGQYSLGGAGGMSGRVSADVPNPQPRESGGGPSGSSLNANINSGFVGSGGASLYGKPAIAPVGGYNPAARKNQPRINPANPSGVNLSSFKPLGGPRFIAHQKPFIGRIGKDGMTGPLSDIFEKVSHRYEQKASSLLP